MAAPAPHTLDEVLAFASTSGMTAFDVARPLWEFTLVEELTDGRSALVTKVHHSLTDGIGAIQLAQHVVDLERSTPELGLPEPASRSSTRYDCEGKGPGFVDAFGPAICPPLIQLEGTTWQPTGCWQGARWDEPESTGVC